MRRSCQLRLCCSKVTKRRFARSWPAPAIMRPASTSPGTRTSRIFKPMYGATVAPYIGLKIREVRVPGDVDAGRMIAGAGQERANLRFVTLEQHNLNWQLRLIVKVAPHAFPNRHHLWIVCDSSHPDRAHAVSSSNAAARDPPIARSF